MTTVFRYHSPIRQKTRKKSSDAVSLERSNQMEIVNFPKIGIGEFFVVDGEKFKKHSELVYLDTAGIEHYIDPLFDRKLGAVVAAPQVEKEQ